MPFLVFFHIVVVKTTISVFSMHCLFNLHTTNNFGGKRTSEKTSHGCQVVTKSLLHILRRLSNQINHYTNQLYQRPNL